MNFHDLEIWKFWYEPPGSKFGNLNTWLNVKNKEETYFPSYYVKNKIDPHFVGQTLYAPFKVGSHAWGIKAASLALGRVKKKD